MAQVRGNKVYRGRHVDAWFDMNYTGIAHYAVTSDDLADALEDLVETTRDYLQAISPRSDRDDDSAHYADSWVTDRYIETRVGTPPFPRGAYTLANTSPHAELVEFGNGNPGDPGHRMFAKAIDYMRARAQ